VTELESIYSRPLASAQPIDTAFEEVWNLGELPSVDLVLSRQIRNLTESEKIETCS